MDVVFDGEREGHVDYDFDEWDVEAAGRDVGGDEEGAGAGFEEGERGGALVLRHVAVDGGGGVVVGEEEGGDAGGFFFVEAEYEDSGERGRGGGLVLGEELEEAGLLLAGIEDLDALGYGGVGAEGEGGVVGADGDVDGVAEEGGGEVADRGGPGGGEHEGLAVQGGCCGDDFADFGFEAFVEHAVGFVKDYVGDVGEVGGAFGYEVVEAAGGGDDDVGGLEGEALRVFGDAAVDADGREVGGGGEGFDLGVDLGG